MKNHHLNPLMATTVASLLFLCVCPVVAGPGGEELEPLAVGNYWIYEREIHAGDNPPLRALDTTAVKSTFEWGGHTWFSYHEEGETDGEREYHRNDQEGSWRLVINEQYPDGKAERVAKLPIKKGYKWSSGIDDLSIEVLSTDETVEVPAGVFNGCYRFTGVFHGGMIATYWLKPGVGRVKMEFEGENQGMKVRMVMSLKEYKVK